MLLRVEWEITYKSPKETLCLRAIGFCSFTISSMPMLAGKLVSISTNFMIEPSKN